MSFMCAECLTIHNVTKAEAAAIEEFMYSNRDSSFAWAFDMEGGWYNEKENAIYYSAINEVNYGLDRTGEVTELSRKFPGQLFEVNGSGEDGAQYREYYQNGKRAWYAPTLVWPEFDPADLKEVG